MKFPRTLNLISVISHIHSYGPILPEVLKCMDMPILLLTGSKTIMICSLQGIAMRQKPVHDRHSKIEVEREWGGPPKQAKGGFVKGAPRVPVAFCFILGLLLSVVTRILVKVCC